MQGVPKRKARAVNKKFILEQRAEMRARLVQLAVDSQLRFGQASLAGFTSGAPAEFPMPGDEPEFPVELE